MSPNTIIYIVDPDESIGEALTALLSTYGARVRVFHDAESFLADGEPMNPGRDCLLLEVDLPGMSGLTLLKKLRLRQTNLPVIMLTNATNQDVRRQALQLGATDVLDKPLISGLLIKQLTELLSGVASPPNRANED